MGAGMQHRGTGSGRFLMALIDGGGTVPPALGLAAELVRRGHRVRVLADPTVEQSAGLRVVRSRRGGLHRISMRWPTRRP